MKKILFASTALAGLAIGGVASAEIALFGSARLGLGYNITNSGGIDLEDGDSVIVDAGTPDEREVVTSLQGTEDFRAVSRIRWGVTMTGESDSGITFGASIRADNADGGGTGDTSGSGQTDGDVFVSGAWGTLTFGDTNAADEQHVGDASGQYSVTGLGDFNETPFISNGGGFGDSDSIQFANNPEARPTVRYDFDIMGFGISLSSNRDLTDIGVGAGYSADFGGGSWTAGVGYYQFEGFTSVEESGLIVVPDAGGGFVVVEGTPVETFVPDGEQWSAGLKATYDAFGFGATYTKFETDDSDFGPEADADNLLIGASFGWDAFSVGLVYGTILSAGGDLEAIDGEDSYQLSASYDLGGGASVNTGVRKTYEIQNLGDDAEGDDAIIADFGIKMAF